MKIELLVLILISLIWNCKENQEIAKPKVEVSKQETVAVVKLPTSIKELAKFVMPTFSDAANSDEWMIFKEIDTNGTVAPINRQRAIGLYKAITKPRQASVMPIFEIKNTDMVILPIQGKGFGGAIWANVVVDKKTLEIKKIAFEHKAESEGYGAALTQSTFEDQFVGAKINLDESSFVLKKNMEQRLDDGMVVDGISGATMTSDGVIEMMNLGLKKYKEYLLPKK